MMETAEQRAGFYKFLSMGFLFPDEPSRISEFNTVFLGDQGVPPYECEFSCSSDFEKARWLADIAGFYRAFGVEPSGERPDHIASELEFLHLLSLKEALAGRESHTEHLEVTLDAERKFFREHLRGWAPRFIQAVRGRAAPDSFYDNLCGALEELLEAEAERLGEVSS